MKALVDQKQAAYRTGDVYVAALEKEMNKEQEYKFLSSYDETYRQVKQQVRRQLEQERRQQPAQDTSWRKLRLQANSKSMQALAPPRQEATVSAPQGSKRKHVKRVRTPIVLEPIAPMAPPHSTLLSKSNAPSIPGLLPVSEQQYLPADADIDDSSTLKYAPLPKPRSRPSDTQGGVYSFPFFQQPAPLSGGRVAGGTSFQRLQQQQVEIHSPVPRYCVSKSAERLGPRKQYL